jgi:uncharacterized membrane protein YeaQ/YmgE (transglycosylase-associated protein family)
VILLFVLVWGMFAGWIANLLAARRQPINWAELLAVGLAGSFVGGVLISLVSGDGPALRPVGIIGSILGAVVLLAAWQAIRETQPRPAEVTAHHHQRWSTGCPVPAVHGQGHPPQPLPVHHRPGIGHPRTVSGPPFLRRGPAPPTRRPRSEPGRSTRPAPGPGCA